MGPALSRPWYTLEKKHRLLGIAISNSTYIDPRHLEHLSYPLWTTEAAHIIACSGLDDFMVAPQFPMWVSEVELPFFSSDPDVSGRTESDGGARGVFVDIAVMQPIIKARSLRVLRSHKALLLGMSLQTFVENTLRRGSAVWDLAPRCLWIDELWAPILIEIKTDVMRHPETLHVYMLSLRRQLNAGKQQSREQGTCLFCSWRFASQDFVFLVAVMGAIWAVCRYTRADAATEFKDNKAFNPQKLRGLKDARPPDDSWAAAQHALMYSTPLTAKDNKRKFDENYATARGARAARRAKIRESLPQDTVDAKTPANYDDRGLPIFRDADIEACHRREYNRPFFETKSPDEHFGAVTAAHGTEWTGALRLGTARSDEYKEFLSKYLRTAHPKEVDRRKVEVFKE